MTKLQDLVHILVFLQLVQDECLSEAWDTNFFGVEGVTVGQAPLGNQNGRNKKSRLVLRVEQCCRKLVLCNFRLNGKLGVRTWSQYTFFVESHLAVLTLSFGQLHFMIWLMLKKEWQLSVSMLLTLRSVLDRIILFWMQRNFFVSGLKGKRQNYSR